VSHGEEDINEVMGILLRKEVVCIHHALQVV
jgi:hypothetical protein